MVLNFHLDLKINEDTYFVKTWLRNPFIFHLIFRIVSRRKWHLFSQCRKSIEALDYLKLNMNCFVGLIFVF